MEVANKVNQDKVLFWSLDAIEIATTLLYLKFWILSLVLRYDHVLSNYEYCGYNCY